MEISLPYLAGFFDGEGSIGVYASGNRMGRTLRVSITQNVSPIVTELLTACRERWGGALTLMNRDAKRQAWIWQASASNGAAVLTALRPFLLIKAEQADVALLWWERRAKTRLRDERGRLMPFSEAEHAADLSAEAALKTLKAVGVAGEAEPIDVVMEDAADLVEVRHTLRQVVNVKGD